MHASVSEICLSLKLSVKVKGCVILLSRRLVQKSRLKCDLWTHLRWVGLCIQPLLLAGDLQCVLEGFVLQLLLHVLRGVWLYLHLLLHAGDPHDVLDWVWLALRLLLHAVDHHSVLYCVGHYLYLFLHAADHHSVLDCVGLDIHLILRAGDLHAFLGGVGFDLHPLLLESDHREVLDWLDLRLLLHAGDYWLPWCSGLSWTLSVPSACRWSTCLSGGRLTLSSPSSACRRAS